MVTTTFDGGLESPLAGACAGHAGVESRHGIPRASSWPATVGVRRTAACPCWVKGQFHERLHHAVLLGWDAISRLHILSSLLQERLRYSIRSTPCVATRSHSAIYVGWAICSNTSWSTLMEVF